MKTVSAVLGLTLWLAPSAHAELKPCHALKFDSYFVAQNVKDNIKRVNPELSKANFAEHFILLRAELAMETLYLIASCDTGEFLHEKISADQARFSVVSNQVDFSIKNGETTHYEWDGHSWIKGSSLSENAIVRPPVNAAKSASDQKASSGPVTMQASLADGYQELFALHATPSITALKCAPLDYASFFRAQNNRNAIEKNKAGYLTANFAGDQLLIQTDTLFDSVYLIADCKSGKFSNEFIQGNLNYTSSSNLVINKSSSQKPNLDVWTHGQWIQIPDPVQATKEPITNTLYGTFAQELVHSLPNPKHLDTLRFEQLYPSSETQAVFRALNVETILKGTCHVITGKAPNCVVETQ